MFQAVSDAEWEWRVFAAVTAAARMILMPVNLVLRCLPGCGQRISASTNSVHLRLFHAVPLVSVTAEAGRWSTLAGKLARLASVRCIHQLYFTSVLFAIFCFGVVPFSR